MSYNNQEGSWFRSVTSGVFLCFDLVWRQRSLASFNSLILWAVLYRPRPKGICISINRFQNTFYCKWTKVYIDHYYPICLFRKNLNESSVKPAVSIASTSWPKKLMLVWLSPCSIGREHGENLPSYFIYINIHKARKPTEIGHHFTHSLPLVTLFA